MDYFIIAKNEELNITKCIESIVHLNSPITLLDSGSNDRTIEIARKYPVVIENYNYRSHCDTYNAITTRFSSGECVIIDADMEISPQLHADIIHGLTMRDVVIAQVSLFWEGQPLKLGGLYPPKPIAFKYGQAYFDALGHGEALKTDIPAYYSDQCLIHNDLKPYSAFLETQLRYSAKLIERMGCSRGNWRDKFRLNTPFIIFLSPLYSLFTKRGVFSQLGWLYALDRLIAEAIMFRQSLASKLKKRRSG
ncbi:MAG: glycosyltransferase [Proteobacteria bacterium]|nr:glycosyltransferase [Pseudomonadota bacterium]